MCVQHIIAIIVSSSKQKEPNLLGEKQASDDGYAVAQMGNTYWAVFYSKNEMSQWFSTDLFAKSTHLGNAKVYFR